MNLNQLEFQNTQRPLKNITHSKKAGLKISDLSRLKAATGKVAEFDFMSQLHEMQVLNMQLEQLLEEQTKKITEIVASNARFITIIAHDLRNPFSSILGALELLKEKMDTCNHIDIEEYINIASESAHKTLKLLESLLEWAVSQNPENSFNPVKINLNQILTEEIENINISARQKQITLNHTIAPGLNVCADLQMVKTIVRNLIGNAIKYTNTGGKITISASESNQFIEIIVKDNGIGISHQARNSLFKTDAFHSTAGTNHEQGAGLGLILCKKFIDMHGCKMVIESEPGCGSEIKFTLPHYI